MFELLNILLPIFVGGIFLALRMLGETKPYGRWSYDYVKWQFYTDPFSTILIIIVVAIFPVFFSGIWISNRIHDKRNPHGRS